MRRRTLGLKVALMGGIVVGLWGIANGVVFNRHLFVVAGCLTMISGIGIFMLSNLVRMAVLIFSAGIFFLNVFWLYLAWSDPWALVGVFFLLPTTLFFFYAAIFVTRSKVRKQFKQGA